ncbi:uncharacterized protein LOC118646837 [Monomorium pharaonis]|uniref:uncharacterized protein LOC118646837 n=1 Tax=Monomorium pharaonis TaxID=307658 RepID=UPI001745F225|nr:uncharacterized protein LOC118646837 [Monomorium pharaonis]
MMYLVYLFVHFISSLPQNLIIQEKWKLPSGIVPNKKISDVTTINVTTSSEVSLLNYPTTTFSNAPITENTNISKLVEIKSTSLTMFDDIDCDNQLISKASSSHLDSEEDFSSPPKRVSPRCAQ